MESLSPEGGFEREGFNKTAPTATGPAAEPRPTSSSATRDLCFFNRFFSSLKVGLEIDLDGDLEVVFEVGVDFFLRTASAASELCFSRATQQTVRGVKNGAVNHNEVPAQYMI